MLAENQTLCFVRQVQETRKTNYTLPLAVPRHSHRHAKTFYHKSVCLRLRAQNLDAFLTILKSAMTALNAIPLYLEHSVKTSNRNMCHHFSLISFACEQYSQTLTAVRQI
jgi:hypothetical protein